MNDQTRIPPLTRAVGTTPIVLRPQPTRPQLPRRESRFTEQMAEEYTPAPSVYDHDQDMARGWDSVEVLSPGAPGGHHSPMELVVRGMNGCTHAAACVILIAIMVEFVKQTERRWLGQMSAQAVALLVFLGVDTLLDIISLVRLHKAWTAWALLFRLVDGIAYIALFMVYVGFGRVFPVGFTFWSMSPGFAGPIVYMFLWLLGVWNLVHVALRRHLLGNGLRSYARSVTSSSTATPRGITSPHPGRPLPPTTHTATQRAPTWRLLWIGKRGSPPASNDLEISPPNMNLNFSDRAMVAAAATRPGASISLRERPAEGSFERGSFTATTRTASSHSSPKSDERGISRFEIERDGEKREPLPVMRKL